MKTWSTTIRAIPALSPERGVITFGGPNVKALTREMAQQWCEDNGLGYCTVGDQLVMEIPCKSGTYEPDWSKALDYDTYEEN